MVRRTRLVLPIRPRSTKGPVLLGALRPILAGGVYAPLLADAVEQPSGVPANQFGTQLTQRQLEVLKLVAKGLTNKDIAQVLGIGAATVKTHTLAIYSALDVTNRTEAVIAMRDLGLDD